VDVRIQRYNVQQVFEDYESCDSPEGSHETVLLLLHASSMTRGSPRLLFPSRYCLGPAIPVSLPSCELNSRCGFDGNDCVAAA